MTPEQMNQVCKDALATSREFGWPESKACVTLVTPPAFKRPPGFPRGYLLQVKDDGSRLWHFNAARLQAWLRKNRLVAT